MRTHFLIAGLAGAASLLPACTGLTPSPQPPDPTARLRADIDTVVVIYAENRAFDNLYGNFPGARNLGEVMDAGGRPGANYHPQVDRDGKPLAVLPPAWGGVTEPGYVPAVTQQQSTGLANAPFSIEHAFTPQSAVTLGTKSVTRDLWHRFFEHQMQIDGGKNDGYAAWSDAGGLSMGHYDYSGSALYKLAREFVLADNFFQGAFGGSFLNHQYLICACAPEYPQADQAPAKPSIAELERDAAGNLLPRLKSASTASALDEPPRFVKSGNVAPFNYFGDGTFHAVNTMQPPFQPSGNAPAADDVSRLYADPKVATTLPVQTQTTIADALDQKGVSWAWYAGSWSAALNDGMQPPPHRVIYAPEVPAGNPDFQPHHQPFNYYQRFDPKQHADYRAQHLKDYDALLADVAAGHLPQVSFYKPQGNLNQHPGYATLLEGDEHIAQLVQKLRASPQWSHMLIVITYDEFGGAWDHVAPPRGDLLGPGARIPAIIVSPFARRGSVDHTQYDTESILRLLTRRFDLNELAGMKMRAAALAAHGAAPMGDLTGALAL
jgi:acid phosphatase